MENTFEAEYNKFREETKDSSKEEMLEAFKIFAKKHFEPADEATLKLYQRFKDAGFSSVLACYMTAEEALKVLESREMQEVIAEEVEGLKR